MFEKVITKGKEVKDIVKNGSVDLGYKTIYYTINYITLLLKGVIKLETLETKIPRVNVTNILNEMNEVIKQLNE